MRDFDFFVGGIEDAILALLKTNMTPMGVKEFELYSGELEVEAFKAAIAALSPRFPLVMATYTDGRDVQDAKTAPVLGAPLHYRHDCSFAVICATDDARGENKRRRGATGSIGTYAMMAKVRELLNGLSLSKMDDDEKVVLTASSLKPAAVEYIARTPDVTAYALIFNTAFRFQTPDRREAGMPVSEFILEAGTLPIEEGENEVPITPTTNTPGVKIEEE